MKTAWIRAALIGVLVVAALVALNSRRDTRRTARQEFGEDADGAPRDPASTATPGDVPSSQDAAPLVTALRAALTKADPEAAQAAAAALRKGIRTSWSARRSAERLLLDPNTPRDLRMALALVLGTLGGSDAALLRALAEFRADVEVARCLLLALGATREPANDDEVFGLGERPWGAMGPGGLGITIRRRIEDPEVRAGLAGFLGDERGLLRETSAGALRHSVDIAEVRSAFLAAIAPEAVDDVALVLGEALAGWAGGTAAGAERTAVVDMLLTRVGDEQLPGFRFRMEGDFRRIELSGEQRGTLVAFAQPGRTLSVRSFALTVLAASAPEDARPVLGGTLARDADPAIRDLSARLLSGLPRNDDTMALLIAASRDDEAWNVRYQAVVALGRFRDAPDALAAIRDARKDPDARVAKLATGLDR